ncbi:hypothetical protein [Polyangium sp. 6x1]|nr:hypothetical protein [Polyangium sp. 6x1]MDI1447482.1 hypothetical protein [Polyangium sp. 6x1]
MVRSTRWRYTRVPVFGSLVDPSIFPAISGDQATTFVVRVIALT